MSWNVDMLSWNLKYLTYKAVGMNKCVKDTLKAFDNFEEKEPKCLK